MEDIEEVYRLYFKEVYYFSLSLSGNRDRAEEVTAETFFKAVKNIDKFQGRSSVRTWLFQIAKNTYFKQICREKGDLPLDMDLEEKRPGPEDRVIYREDLDRVCRALEDLPEKQRILFHLRVDGGLSFKEIARVLGGSENGACVTFYRIRQSLKKALREEE